MPCWTTHELRRLAEMHKDRRPSQKELFEAFPRHTMEAVRVYANQRHPARIGLNLNLKWLRLAHLHFARREAG